MSFVALFVGGPLDGSFHSFPTDEAEHELFYRAGEVAEPFEAIKSHVYVLMERDKKAAAYQYMGTRKVLPGLTITPPREKETNQ